MKIINVANVNDLYTAVNDVANTGKRIVLAPGIYPLGPNLVNAGRLELQQDMHLQGQPGDASLVTIDESGLPDLSFSIPPFKTGGIRIGKGSNKIEWLTVAALQAMS